MNVANHLATVASDLLGGGYSDPGKRKGHLTGDYPADATLDTQAIPLQPIFAIYAPDQAADLSGQTEIHATLHGPLKNKKLLEAHLTIPTLKLAYSNIDPVSRDFSHPRGLQRHRSHAAASLGLSGTDTDLQFHGSMSTSKDAPMSLVLLGTVNLHLAQVFEPDIRSSGELKFNINSSGATDQPRSGRPDRDRGRQLCQWRFARRPATR